ncbi:MAG: hypothetical protein R3244_06675, partial [Thermoanaerobaculia bacterium]|nr:hypothetical protein [Thermoanaerobaculia bacterium]
MLGRGFYLHVMRLFLSSHGLGRHGRRLAELTGGGGRALLVANALDAAPEESRRAVFVRTAAALDEIGFDVGELDLRRYFTWSDGLAAKAAGADLLFVT